MPKYSFYDSVEIIEIFFKNIQYNNMKIQKS